MSGYPPPGSSYPYGGPPGSSYPYGGSPPPNPYAGGAPATQQPYGSAPYGAPPQPSAPYAPAGDKPPKENKYGFGPTAPPQPYGAPPTSTPYGASPPGAPYGASPPGGPYGAPPPGAGAYPYPAAPPSQPYGGPFASLVPSAFPPGTDPNVVACFQAADRDGSGFIDDKELQGALSSYNQSFSMRTVHLLMYLFTGNSIHRIGPKEFTSVFYSLQNWRAIFERSDRDRSGKIDAMELRDALLSLGFAVSPTVLDLLVSKFDKSGGRNRAIEYDNFIECCLTVKGLTEKFKEKDPRFSGSATFTYESFMLTILPFLIA